MDMQLDAPKPKSATDIAQEIATASIVAIMGEVTVADTSNWRSI